MKKTAILFLLIITFSSCSKKLVSYYASGSDFKKGDNTTEECDCNNPKNYYPSNEIKGLVPFKEINVAMHYIRGESDADYMPLSTWNWYGKDIIKEANKKLANNQKMLLPVNNSTPVLPTQYRFKIIDSNNDGKKDVLYHINEERAGFTKKNEFEKIDYDLYGVAKGEATNIFFIEYPLDSLKSKTFKVSKGGVGYLEWVKMTAPYQIMNKVIGHNAQGKPYGGGTWYLAPLLNHELGHSYGLAHAWYNDRCDDTPVYKPVCWTTNSSEYCKTHCSNNMMDYNYYQDAVTPDQLGIIHRNLSKIGSKYRNHLNKRYCNYNKESTITIPSAKHIKIKGWRDYEGDIIVEENATLEIFCRINLAKGAKIIVHPNATLIINGGSIDNACGEKWRGIQLRKIGTKKGKVIMKNNGTIKNYEY